MSALAERFDLPVIINVPPSMPDQMTWSETMLALWHCKDPDAKAAALDMADQNRIAAQHCLTPQDLEPMREKAE